MRPIHPNFMSFATQDVALKQEAWSIVCRNDTIYNGFTIVDGALRACLVFQDIPTARNEDLVTRLLAMRSLNSFMAAVDLITGGLPQPAFSMLRDIMEMTFLADLFTQDAAALTRWLDSGGDGMEFRPAAIRKALNKAHGATGKTERDTVYSALCKTAVHFSNHTPVLMRSDDPQFGMVSGPFVNKGHLEAFAFEGARLAICLVDSLSSLRPPEHDDPVFNVMKRISVDWAIHNKDNLPGVSATYGGGE